MQAVPGRWGIGDLGPEAAAFAEFLQASGQSLWQVLPLGVTSPATGNSPYNSVSAFALDPLLSSPEALLEAGLLERGDLPRPLAGGRVRYGAARRLKARLLALAWERFRKRPEGRAELERFRAREAAWIEDFITFEAIRRRLAGRPWPEWPAELRRRSPAALRQVARDCGEERERSAFAQYLADLQWTRLRGELAQRGIEVVGDVPFYVAHDSADVWAHPDLFALDSGGRPEAVSGCPPDAFAADGQLWGQPVYRWEAHREEGFCWWLARLERQVRLFDRVRIDHFRGLVATWQVPARAATAASGHWAETPGQELVAALRARFRDSPWIAEDLGVLSDEVHALRRELGAPGIRVLQFAFGADYPASEHLPERAPADSVLYSGTHDNNTLRGWIEEDAGGEERHGLREYLGGDAPPAEAAAELLRRCLASAARWVVLPAADLLGLGSEARINRPGAARGQWSWRLRGGELTAELAGSWRERMAASGRLGASDLRRL